MSRCIQLAKNGLGTTYPNPLVGSVIVHNNIVIGEGWHYKAGSPHAEVNAINATEMRFASETSRLNTIFSEATIYVSLEPCSHYGKTPPCADLIIEKGIKKVVIGSTDPNPKVAGRGIKKLIEAGCEVILGILENECDTLNKRFFTFQNKKRPFIILKWAETTDGFIAPLSREEKAPVWITNKQSRQFTHKMRTEEQAILVGTTTVLKDNPSLTARDWEGNSPVRVVIDKNLKILTTASIYDEKVKTIILTEVTKENNGNLFFEALKISEDIPNQICKTLYKHSIQSVIIEGGTRTIQAFIDTNLWDEAFVFKGNSTFKKGVQSPVLKGKTIEKTLIKGDELIYFKNQSL
ncbi:riboflavin biosynthesis protein RibD [Patiriisocius marinistellae]|uniref:Riboflavin biosynthesis protein RibD n=2 Tax=Patiriisocius marinistellae TaxID=2494560 RepID=A0A5J4FX87_9FLAO|nr:riboflavin biosynthesis protein RibD [Patiriisocius marinistellae]